MKRLTVLLLLILIGCGDRILPPKAVGRVQCFGTYTGVKLGDWAVANIAFFTSESSDSVEVYSVYKDASTYKQGNLIGRWPINQVVCFCTPLQ